MTSDAQYITLTDNNFQQEVLEAKVPILVECWATWCNPYYLTNPTLSELAADFAEQVKVGRLNIAVFARIATHYHIRAVPTLLIFNNREVVSQVIGGVPKAVIAAKLNFLLQSSYLSRSRMA